MKGWNWGTRTRLGSVLLRSDIQILSRSWFPLDELLTSLRKCGDVTWQRRRIRQQKWMDPMNNILNSNRSLLQGQSKSGTQSNGIIENKGEQNHYVFRSINNHLLSRVRVIREILEPRVCGIGQPGRGLWLSRKDRTIKVNKVFIIWLFTVLFWRPVTGRWALRENDALELANPSACYISSNTSDVITEN